MKRTPKNGTGKPSPGSSPTRDSLKRERMVGIAETAVTVHHEINSPLTAILGNVRLLLRDVGTLDKPVADKLKTIEVSAERIVDVTRRLLRVTRPDSVEYVQGIRMLDISDDNQIRE